MELFSVSLEGYRRFRDRTMLRTNGKLLALVGPNEAGKSSILAALSSVNTTEALEPEDVARGANPADLEIVASFLLDHEECAAARLPYPTWLNVHKKHNGKRLFGFRPAAPGRDVSHRATLVAATEKMLESGDIEEALHAADEDIRERLERVSAELAKAGQTAPKQLQEALKEGADLFEQVPDLVERDRRVRDAAQAWRAAVELEAMPTPIRHAIDTLDEMVPTFLLFDQEARQLKSSYQMGTLSSGVPAPLGALLEIAGVGAPEILAAVTAADVPELATLERRANRTLEDAFKEAWHQSGITVALRLSLSDVEVHIVNEDERYTRLAERSDGLRQFVALHAFAAQRHADRPILLIDEAEQRLHYDAQADLVQMLIRQTVASKVIYTTHSAGCLPEDLGHGVRLVQPDPDQQSCSRVVNKFWAASGSGISPLLFGLGATTLAFFPTRRAVCVEGPADMLLYPAMFREALGEQSLGFQFVPGLSTSARALAPIMPADAANVAFLVDGDDGGRSIARDLVAGGVPDARVLVLEAANRHAVEIEDFVEPALLLQAANALLARHHAGAQPLARADLPSRRRMEALEAAYRVKAGVDLPKVELAYEILDLLDAEPERRILDDRRRSALGELARRVKLALAT